MSLAVVSKSPYAVLDLEEVKGWLRIDNSDEDRRAARLLAEASEYVEQHARQVLSPTVYQLVLDAFPAVNWYQYYPVMAPFPQLLTLGLNFFLPNQTVNLDVSPVTSIDWIKYVDVQTGLLTTVDPSLYTPSIVDGRLAPAAQQVWPYAKNQLDAVTIQFHAGYAVGAVPFGLQQCILNRCLLNYMNPGGIPADDLANLNAAIEAQRRNLLV